MKFPQHEISSVRDHCFAAIRKFCPTLLSLTQLSAGGVVVPVEAHYAHELSHACYQTLGDIFLDPEWKGQSSCGKVDFYIEPVKWAIECNREGTHLQEHIRRFQPGGKYYPWIESGEIKDYILLDFQTSKPAEPQGMFALSPGLISTDQ